MGHSKQFNECAITSVVIKIVSTVTRPRNIVVVEEIEQQIFCWSAGLFKNSLITIASSILSIHVGQSWRVLGPILSSHYLWCLREKYNAAATSGTYLFGNLKIRLPSNHTPRHSRASLGIGGVFALDVGILKEIPRIGACIISPSIGRHYPSRFKASIVVDQI